MSAQQVRISAIHLEGNLKTRDLIIYRELPFQSGDTIQKSDLTGLLELSKNQLVNLNLFNEVLVTSEYSDFFKVKVHIKLTEKWYLWPIPTLEYADRNVNQWYSFKLNPERLNYGLYNFRYNAFGLNHTFKLALIHGYTRNYGFEYRIPYWDKKRQWGSSFQASRRLNHEIVYATAHNRQQFYKDPDRDVNRRSSISGSLFFRPKMFTRFHLNAGYYHQQVSDTVLKLNPDFSRGGINFSLIYIGLGVHYQKTDNQYYPTKGIMAGSTLSVNRLPETYQNWIEVSAWGEHYKPLLAKVSHGLFVGGRLRNRISIPYPLTSALGYKYYVRGFEPYVIEGNNFILIKSEFRYDLIKNKLMNTGFIPLKNYKKTITSSQLTFFSDAGYVSPGGNVVNYNDLSSKWMAGVGLGWNWVFYFDKVVRFEYSVNHTGDFLGNLHFTKSF